MLSKKRNSNGTVRRYFNGNVILHVSREVIKNKLLSLEAMKVVTKRGKETWVSKGRTYMIDNEAHEIVSQFNTEIRGFYNYYSIANNASALGRSFGCIMKLDVLSWAVHHKLEEFKNNPNENDKPLDHEDLLSMWAIPWSYRDWETDRKSTRLNSSHFTRSRMPSSA